MCNSEHCLHDGLHPSQADIRNAKARSARAAKREMNPAKPRKVKPQGTHESYIQAIYKAVFKYAPGPGLDSGKPKGLAKDDVAKLKAIKLAYGAGPDGTRGVTYYHRWRKPDSKQAIPLVAICATGQESHVQVCGTTLHELAHVMAGMGQGHGAGWQDACTRIGLRNMSAAGTAYAWEDNFTPTMARALQAIPLPADGTPVSSIGAAVGALLGPWGAPLLGAAVRIRPCGAGYGTAGGQSRGKGSGSRYLRYTCKCETRNSIRHAGTELDATCNKCKTKFVLDSDSLPPAHGKKRGKTAKVEPKPKKKRAVKK